MRRHDVDAMMRWRPSVDPLYQPFDFPQRSRSEHMHWFRWRSQDAGRRLYTVEDEASQVIGSLTLREVKRPRSARLGITLGADYVSQGYGKEALQLFLDHFFGVMGFAEMVLDVSATNVRAVHLYESLGFRRVGQHYRPASHPSFRILRRDPRYRHLQPFFRYQGSLCQVLFYDMILTQQEWQARSRAAVDE